MADRSKIEWTDASWNPIRALGADDKPGWHCEHVSEGCRHCYAEAMNARLGTGLAFKPGNIVRQGRLNVPDAAELFLDDKMLLQPLKWKRPRRIFVCSMTDLFADFVPDEWIDRLFAVMALCGGASAVHSAAAPVPQHTFQVLTKRSARMRRYLKAAADPESERALCIYHAAHAICVELKWTAGVGLWPYPNVWLGVSAERQQEADQRIPDLLATPAAVRFVSLEPLLGPIDLTRIDDGEAHREVPRAEWGPVDNDESPPSLWWDALTGERTIMHGGAYGDWARTDASLDWVIVGGESGREARPMHPDWARALRDQCILTGVPFFFKQWGEWRPVCQMDDAECSALYRSNRVAKDGEDQGNLDDVYGRTCKVPTLCLRVDGGHCDANSPNAFLYGTKPVLAFRVGKNAAGNLLDGREWIEWPAAAQRASDTEKAIG